MLGINTIRNILIKVNTTVTKYVEGSDRIQKIVTTSRGTIGMGIEKLPIDRPDRVRSAVIKLSKKKNIDLYMFDFTRTRGEETRFNDLFEVIEEIKNSYIVDIMYGNFNRAFLKPAMVIIFTNEDISKFSKYLSLDRTRLSIFIL